jgi:hypothetical protein
MGATYGAYVPNSPIMGRGGRVAWALLSHRQGLRAYASTGPMIAKSGTWPPYTAVMSPIR